MKPNNKKSAHKRETSNGVKHLLNAGTEIIGGGASGAVGAGIGLLIGGPPGALAGGAGAAAVSHAIKSIGHEFSKRILAPREEARVGAVFLYAVDELQRRIENGETVREDGFFDPKQKGRSDAEEVVENVVLKCQREPEEKKIQYMGYLLASLAFDHRINVNMAHQLVRTAEQLTYRQLCILKMAKCSAHALRSKNYREQNQFPKELYSILYEIHELYNRGLITFKINSLVPGITDVVPGKMIVEGIGDDIGILMRLQLIPAEEIEPIMEKLK